MVKGCGRFRYVGPSCSSFSEHIRDEFGRNSRNGRQKSDGSGVGDTVAQVLVARATVFDAYVRGRVDGARTVVVPAVRRPRARSDYHQLAVHCKQIINRCRRHDIVNIRVEGLCTGDTRYPIHFEQTHNQNYAIEWVTNI